MDGSKAYVSSTFAWNAAMGANDPLSRASPAGSRRTFRNVRIAGGRSTVPSRRAASASPSTRARRYFAAMASIGSAGVRRQRPRTEGQAMTAATASTTSVPREKRRDLPTTPASGRRRGHEDRRPFGDARRRETRLIRSRDGPAFGAGGRAIGGLLLDHVGRPAGRAMDDAEVHECPFGVVPPRAGRGGGSAMQSGQASPPPR